ncbi:MAG: Hsp33 family molecular chaperone HslO [Steroidobacteraceae bacterium]
MAEDSGRGSGELRRFLLDPHPVRGQWVQLRDAWNDMRAWQQYPPAVEELLGQAAVASVLLAATLKFDGQLTLQLAGNGRVSLLVAQCTRDFELRAIAHHSLGAQESASFAELIGDGRLVVTLETEHSGARYQGVVPLQGATLAECLENYFASSEQLPTRLALLADHTRASGVLLQKLPQAAAGGEAQAARAEAAWDEMQKNLLALPVATLRSAAVEEVARQLCGEFDCHLHGGTPVRFACRCSPERVTELLRLLGEQEAQAVLAEHGHVTVTCEFCAHPYRFDAIDIERVFAQAGTSPTPSRTLN